MTDHHECGVADAHTHFTALPLLLRAGLPLVVLDGRPVVVCFDALIADRVAVLINEHGLLAVADGMPVPPQPWPAPTGQQFAPPWHGRRR